jgi:hypothetical protein
VVVSYIALGKDSDVFGMTHVYSALPFSAYLGLEWNGILKFRSADIKVGSPCLSLRKTESALVYFRIADSPNQ